MSCWYQYIFGSFYSALQMIWFQLAISKSLKFDKFDFEIKNFPMISKKFLHMFKIFITFCIFFNHHLGSSTYDVTVLGGGGGGGQWSVTCNWILGRFLRKKRGWSLWYIRYFYARLYPAENNSRVQYLEPFTLLGWNFQKVISFREFTTRFIFSHTFT